MKNPELCCNCAHWTICKAEGVMPNDYCGQYQPFYTEEELEIVEHCRQWRKEHGCCNNCKYSTDDYDCKHYEITAELDFDLNAPLPDIQEESNAED